MDVLYSWLPLESIMALSAPELIFTLLIGCVIGLALGMTGVGGGVLMIPLLRGVFGMSPVLAVGTASLCAFLMKINAAAIHVRMGNISWRKSGLMLAGAVPATFLTTKVIVRMSQNVQTAELITDQQATFVIRAQINPGPLRLTWDRVKQFHLESIRHCDQINRRGRVATHGSTN